MRIWKILPKITAAVALAFAVLLMGSSYSAKAATTNLLSGQKQYYTVMMRADKQSLVYAKVTFENPSATDELKSFSFMLPDDVTVSNLTAQQILAKTTTKTCKTYETYDEYKNHASTYEQGQYYYNQYKRCVTYDTATTYDEDYDFDSNMSSSTDYYYYSYYLNRSTDSTFAYTDLTAKQNGQTYTVTLSNPVQPKKQGAILVAYTSKSYINGGVGGRFSYDFRTFTAKELVNKAVVAINFDDEIYSTLTSSKRQVSTSSTALSGATADSTTAYESKSVDDIQTGVGQGGRYVKEKLQLLPGETFSVKGVFATSKFMLYIPSIIRWLLVLLFIGAAVLFGYRLYRTKHPRVQAPDTEGLEPSSGTVVPTETPMTLSIGGALSISLAAVGLTTLLIAPFAMAASSIDSYASVTTSLMVILVGVIGLITLFVLPFLHVIVRYDLRGAYRWLLCHVAVLIAMVLIIPFTVAVLRDEPQTYTTNDTVETTVLK